MGHAGQVKKTTTHLFILVHGILGSKEDWTEWIKRLNRRRRPDWVVYAASSITPGTQLFGTGDLRELGALLAKEVIKQAKELLLLRGHVTLHFICHSLGGLEMRAALPEICDGLLGYPGINYGHVLTMCSPHLGVRGDNVSTFWKNAFTFCDLHKQATLQDNRLHNNVFSHSHRQPGFLEEMADPEEIFCRSLARFQHRTAVAATHWDLAVSFCSAAICSENPFPAPPIKFKSCWRIVAAVGFAEDSAFIAKVRWRWSDALRVEWFQVSTPEAQSHEASGNRGTGVRSYLPSWTTSDDHNVKFTKQMLGGLASLHWRRIGYMLHAPGEPSVHTFAIAKDQTHEKRKWAIEFIDLLIDMLQIDL